MILERILESAIMTTIDDVINGSQYMIRLGFQYVQRLPVLLT